MKRLHNKVRVLVADGGRALILHNEGDAESPNLKLVRSYGQDNPPTREQGAERPGRQNDALGRLSAMEAADYHQIAEDRFIQTVAADMAKDLAAGKFTALVVLAPPIALGEYRKSVSPDLAKATICEIDKDFTKHPMAHIEKAVVAALEKASFER